MTDATRRHIGGKAMVLPGDDIDTDRIMPGRFLKEVSFAALDRHVFADERRAAAARGDLHPFDEPRWQGASILVVGRNFGCGSSREHAPQGLRRWGIAAVVGEGFGDIFAANCTALGVPCLRVTAETAAQLREAADGDTSRPFTIDLGEKTIRRGNLAWPVELPEGARAQFLNGSWDATATLLAAGRAIEAVAARLPYLNGWA